MIDIIKSIDPKFIITVIVCFLVAGWLKVDNYKLKQVKHKLRTELDKASAIIKAEQIIINEAIKKDSSALAKVDSIQILRNENDTITFRLSDIDSIRAIWANDFK